MQRRTSVAGSTEPPTALATLTHTHTDTHTDIRVITAIYVHTYSTYLYIRAFGGLTLVGETHVAAKPETVGLVVDMDLT